MLYLKKLIGMNTIIYINFYATPKLYVRSHSRGVAGTVLPFLVGKCTTQKGGVRDALGSDPADAGGKLSPYRKCFKIVKFTRGI
jgi:hypothetical protein